MNHAHKLKALSSQADVWSVGCIIYELLTFKKPFDNEKYQYLCDQIKSSSFINIELLEVRGIDQELIDKETSLIAEELKNSGKPEEIAKKISLGKINKFKDENSLMTQDWVMDPKIKVKDVIKGLEIPNLNVNEFVRLKIGE